MKKSFSAPENVRARYEQAMVDADIEGLARDAETEALIEQWHADGLTPDECIERLKALVYQRQLTPAE